MTDEQQQPIKSGCPAVPSLNDQLVTLRGNLLEHKQDLKEAEVEIGEHEAQISVLSALIDEIDQIVVNYRLKYQELKNAQDGFKKFYDEEQSCLESILTQCKARKVCPAAKECVDEIDTQKGKIKETEKELDTEHKKREEEADRLKEKKQSFEAWKTPVKSIEARVKTLNSVKKAITDEHNANHHAISYYLLTCEIEGGFHGNLNDSPKVVDPDQLRAEIEQAWRTYQKADQVYNAQDVKVSSKKY